MKYYIKYILQSIIAFLFFPFRLFPIKKNRILFLSLEGGSHCEYSCNPKYFCEYLLHTSAKNFELVWLFTKPKDYSFLHEKGIRTARHFSLKGLYYALTSRVVISNGGYLTWFPFRKEQLCINTWHGSGAYKKLENDAAGANTATRKRMEHAARHTAAFLSGCRQFSNHVIRGAFLYDGEILPIGMPRNDIFFSGQMEHYYESVRQTFKLPKNSRILLYAPTFRTHTAQNYPALDAELILSHLRILTGDEWYLFYRAHIQAGNGACLKNLTECCLDSSAYPDTQQLLCASDWLITDYSSIVWDFSLTNRPILLYTPDLDAYCSGRGFYVDIRDWGFPLCHNTNELINAFPQILSGTYKNGPRHHHELLGSYESGHSCADLLDYILEHA